MHPHSALEDQQLDGDHYGSYAQVWLSDTPQGTDINPASVLGQNAEQPEGFESLLGFSIDGDLESQVVDAKLRVNLGLGPKSISPYMTGGALVNGRPLFDPGRYLNIYAKCFDPDPSVLVPPAANPVPTYQGQGNGDAGTGALSVAWHAGHQADDVGVLFVQTANQAVPSITGWSSISSLGIGGAGASLSFIAAASIAGNPTTTGTITIPSVVTGDDLYVSITSRDHVNATALPTCTDNDGGTWVLERSTAQRRGHLFWRKATSGTSAKTITIAGAVGSLSGGVSVWRGGAAGDPTVNISAELNGSGSPVHFGFLPSFPDSVIAIAIHNESGAKAVTSVACTDPGALNQRFESLSTGGNDCGCTVWSARQTGGPTTTGSFTWSQTNGQTTSIAWAIKPSATGGAGNMLTMLWKRAASSNESSVTVPDSGDHQVAAILGFRGVRLTGNPFSTAAGSGATDLDATVSCPTITTSADNCLIVAAVSNVTASLAGQSSFWQNPSLTDVVQRADAQTDVGVGGGFSVATGTKALAGATGVTTALLDTESSRVTFTFDLVPPPPSGVPIQATLEDLPWRPIFCGRIDSVTPNDQDELEVQCRDIVSDALGTWIKPDATGGFAFGQMLIGELLQGLLNALPFYGMPPIELAIIGDPTMAIPDFVLESKPILQAMREKSLLNGWDLRGRFGTGTSGPDKYVLTYYEPDRDLVGTPYTLSPNRYYAMHGLTKSRDEVRNDIEVTPADPPRGVAGDADNTSIALYGRFYAGIIEDMDSGVRTQAQAAALAHAILEDLKEPKVMAEIETRFLPWVEINDVLVLLSDNIRHDHDLTVAVSGYTHTMSDGEFTTTLRTRDLPAAANQEWRRKAASVPMALASPHPPSGIPRNGQTWTVVT